jgi:hypothetical protein
MLPTSRWKLYILVPYPSSARREKSETRCLNATITVFDHSVFLATTLAVLQSSDVMENKEPLPLVIHVFSHHILKSQHLPLHTTKVQALTKHTTFQTHNPKQWLCLQRLSSLSWGLSSTSQVVSWRSTICVRGRKRTTTGALEVYGRRGCLSVSNTKLIYSNGYRTRT